MVQTYSVLKVHQITATIAPKPKFRKRRVIPKPIHFVILAVIKNTGDSGNPGRGLKKLNKITNDLMFKN